MAFLAPFFFAALAALAIPILVHLLQTHKPKAVTFSTLAFFSELRKKTMRRLALKRWILLALRLFAVAMLALALMRPFLKPEAVFWSGGPALYGILIENGPSMSRIDGNGPYWDQAKAAALALIDLAKESDRFLIEPTFGPAEPTPPLTPAQARLRLQSIARSDAANRTSERWERLKSYLGQQTIPNRSVYWIGDARAAQAGILSTLPPEGVTIVRVGGGGRSNLQVESVHVRDRIGGPGRPIRFDVTVRNTGDLPVPAGFVSLEQDGQLRSQFPIGLEPGARETVLFETVAPEGAFVGRILLEGDAYAPDNQHPLSFTLPTRRRVVVAGPTPDRSPFWMAADAAREVSSILDVTRSTVFTTADAIVVHHVPTLSDADIDRLTAMVQGGGGLILFPSPDADPSAYNPLLSRLGAGRFVGSRGLPGSNRVVASLDAITVGHPILDDVFDHAGSGRIRAPLPDLFHQFIYNPAGQTAGAVILRSALGEALLTEHPFGSGVVFVAAFGTDDRSSTFPVNPLYAPLMMRLIQTAAGVGRVTPLSVTLGDPLTLVMRAGEAGSAPRIRIGDTEVVPDVTRLTDGRVRLSAPTVDWTAGFAQIRYGTVTRSLAVAPSLPDHDLTPLSDDAIAATEGATLVAGAAATTGRELTSILLVLALLALVAESLVARYMTS